MEGVQLKDDVLCQHSYCRTDATSSGEVSANLAIFLFNVAHFQDTPVQLAIKAITQLLCHVAQVKIVVSYLIHVDMLTEIWVRSIRSAELDSLCQCHIAIGTLTSRCTSENAHLERTSCFMFCSGQLCQFLCCCLSCTSRCETTKTNLIAILYQRSCLKG